MAGSVLGELDEYLVFGEDVLDATHWQDVIWDLFYAGELAWEQNFARQDRARAVASDPRSPQAIFATGLCFTSVYRGDPGRLRDGGRINGGIVDAHDVRVVTAWWKSFADGDAAPSASTQTLGIGKAKTGDWWWVFEVGVREALTPLGLAGEVQRCETPLDGAALAGEAATLASTDTTAAEAAATIVGLLRFAAPAATADLGEWERVVAAGAAPQYVERAVAEARIERDEMAQVGIQRLLRAPVCYIERPAAAPAGEGLGLERLVELLTEQWYLDGDGVPHNAGPFLTAVPMAATSDGRWVQYADRQDVVGDTTAEARAAAIRRHLAACNGF